MGITFSELIFGKSEYKFGKKSKVIIKFTNSVSVPKNMGFKGCSNAFGGRFSAIVRTDYDVYHMRRMLKVKTLDMNASKGKVKSDDSSR